MLHEIQAGDVLIVTVGRCAPSEALRKLADLASVWVVENENATETSVHVIRAKKAEDTPKPDWPAWMDVNVEKPPRGVRVLVHEDNRNQVFTAWWDGEHFRSDSPRRTIGATHWMQMVPLPEGPK